MPDILGELPIARGAAHRSELIEFCNDLGGEFANLATIDTLKVECNGDAGTVTVVGASALGSAVPLNLENVAPNTELFPDNPLLQRDAEPSDRGAEGRFHRRWTCRLARRG